MLVYSLNLAVVTFFSFLAYYFKNSSRPDKKGVRKPLIWFAAIVILSLTLVGGLRFQVGTDYLTYVILYSDANHFQIGTSWIKTIEVGFVLLCRLLYPISTSPFFMFFVTSLLINALIVMTLREHSKIFWLSCFLFIVTMAYYDSFNGLRQTIAVAIIFAAVGFLLEKKIIPYFICVAVAVLFHTSALVLVPAYFFVHRPAWSPLTWVLLAVTAIVVVLYNQFTSLFLMFLSSTKYSNYENAISSAQNGANALRVVIAAAPLILAYIFRKKLEEKHPNSHIYVNMSFLGFLFIVLATREVTFARIGAYFSIYQLLLIPQLISIIENKGLRTFLTVVIMVCYTAYSYMVLPVESNLLPYKSIFEAPPKWNYFDFINR